jgi:DNA-binding MarR family transcriptional regulator
VKQSRGTIRKTKETVDLEGYWPYLLKTISEYIAQGTHSKEYQGHTVGLREWRVLSLIAQYGSVSAKQVAFYAGMDKGTVSRAVNRLKESGLIFSKPNPESWRLQSLLLTNEGEATYHRIAIEKNARAKEMSKGLTDEEHKQLIYLLQKLKQSVLDALDIEFPDLSAQKDLPSPTLNKTGTK